MPSRTGAGSRLRAFVQNVALSLASLAVMFLVLETTVRVLAGRRGGKEQREGLRYTRYDPVVGWRAVPGATASFSRRDYETAIHMNSQGLRDRERPVAKPAGEFRVVALGDSFVEAFMMDDDETPTEVLRRELARPGCAVDVVNAGLSGYSTDQEYLVYDRDAHRYQPDIVVLFTYHNDIPPLLWGADKPILDLSVDPPRVANEPVPARTPPPPAPERTPGPFLRSDLLRFVQERLEDAPPDLRGRLEDLGVVGPLKRGDTNDELLLFSRKLPEHLDQAIGIYEGIVAALRRRVEQDGARLLVAYIPSRIEVNPEDWERTKARYRVGDKRFDPGALVPRLAAAASQAGAAFVDLTPALRATRGLVARPYFRTDSHWNALGAAAGARAVAGELRTRRWLPPCALPAS